MAGTTVRVVHFIEDDLHNYALVGEFEDGSLMVGPHAIPPSDVSAAAAQAKDDYPGATVLIEEWSGDPPLPVPHPNAPYPMPMPRKVHGGD